MKAESVIRRLAVVLCLLFSGLAALVYQVIWTRLLGFTFGHTTEAISTVLAIFFGGMALGNFLAARTLGLKRALETLRLIAPSPSIAIGVENSFRSHNGLPLLPQDPSETLLGLSGPDN